MNDRDDLVGRTLADRYRIDELIARGGMARVFRARDERLDRDVAIKVLSAPYADDPDFTGRFLGEARAAASLSHPGLVHVYDSGTDDGAHFIVMELLDRHRTLRDVVAERGPLGREEVLRIGRELLAGLAVVHDRGLVHCDVKSANVMLGPGTAKLIDFGIATAPHDGLEGDTSIGSLPFMSPEQLHGEALTPASDLFSLGAVLYEALTGRAPFPGTTPEEISRAHAEEAVRPPSELASDVPARLDDVILQALRREPAGRFRSAEAMRVALDAAARAPVASADDETRVVRTAGYVPPSAPGPPPARSAPEPAARPIRRAPPRSGTAPRRRRGVPWTAIGTAAVLGVAALVVLLVVVPLLRLGDGEGVGPTPSASSAATAPPGGTGVTVPAFVGMSTGDAIDLARQTGLSWTVFCDHDESRPEGIIHQEPPPDSEVPPGSSLSLYSARISDCE